MALAAMLLVTGCSIVGGGKSGFQPKENCAYIEKDGKVQWASVETYGEGAFSEEEMLASANERIGDFNRSLGKENADPLPVAVVSGSLKDGKAVLVTAYDTPERLVEFAQSIGDYNVGFTQMSTGTIDSMAGELNSVSCLDYSGKALEDPAGAAKDGGKLVIKAEGPGLIRTEDKIKLVSEGCSLRDEHTVQTAAEGISYIVTR